MYTPVISFSSESSARGASSGRSGSGVGGTASVSSPSASKSDSCPSTTFLRRLAAPSMIVS